MTCVNAPVQTALAGAIPGSVFRIEDAALFRQRGKDRLGAGIQRVGKRTVGSDFARGRFAFVLIGAAEIGAHPKRRRDALAVAADGKPVGAAGQNEIVLDRAEQVLGKMKPRATGG